MGQLFALSTRFSDFSFVASFRNYGALKAKIKQNLDFLTTVKFRDGRPTNERQKRKGTEAKQTPRDYFATERKISLQAL